MLMGWVLSELNIQKLSDNKRQQMVISEYKCLKTESCFLVTASLHRQLINGKILKV